MCMAEITFSIWNEHCQGTAKHKLTFGNLSGTANFAYRQVPKKTRNAGKLFDGNGWCRTAYSLSKIDVSKTRGKTPKMDGENGKPYSNGWCGGTIIFGNTLIFHKTELDTEKNLKASLNEWTTSWADVTVPITSCTQNDKQNRHRKLRSTSSWRFQRDNRSGYHHAPRTPRISPPAIFQCHLWTGSSTTDPSC